MTADQPAQGTDGLLPCPWCNSPARLTIWASKTTGRKFARVYCDAPNPPGCPVEPFIDYEKQEQAIAAWNRRAPSPAVAETWAECFDAQKSVIFFLRETLEQIKRDNQQYNFGSKLVRIVDAALAKVPAPPKENDHG